MRKTLVALLLTSSLFCNSQQGPDTKFGKISVADLERKSYTIDTGAAAIVLADIGSTQIKGNKKEWFSLEFKQFRRLHILNKNGYDEATIEIPLYTDGEMEELLDGIKAVTYNLENGKVVETKLDVKTALFKEKIDKNKVVRKFTFPNVREGSIIEYEYKITSDFLFNLQPWYYQDAIPTLWSEYTVSIPQFFNYKLINQVSQPIFLTDRKDKTGTYTVEVKNKDHFGFVVSRDRINISCGVSDFRWAMKDVPALKEEAFTSTIRNYVSRMEFQLAAYEAPLTPERFLTTWQEMAERLLKRDDFGQQLEAANSWMPSVLPKVLQNATTDLEKAKKVYSYVRDNFTCTSYRELYTDNSLKSVFEKKNGSIAEINLLLTALLRAAGLTADPVILSRKSMGFVYVHYPIIGRYNYVITRTVVDGNEILLDAGHSNLGFGKLTAGCYNGQARVVNAQAKEINLTADLLNESESTSVILNGDANGEWTGKVVNQLGEQQSLETRGRMKENREEFVKSIARGYQNDVNIENLKIDSIENLEAPIKLKYDIAYKSDLADMLYINPVLAGNYKQNPFKSSQRQYPVEIPYKGSESYSIVLTIPAGYKVDEVPKSQVLLMDEKGSANFEYKVSRPSSNTISVQTRFVLNKTTFQPTEYETLREFFSQLVAKQSEQIVLKKGN